jgi:hypothetical protein
MSEYEEFVEETNSGLRKKGDWRKIAELGEEMQENMKGSAEDSSIEKFEDWRPGVEKSETGVKQKTVEKAKLSENGMEKECNGV